MTRFLKVLAATCALFAALGAAEASAQVSTNRVSVIQSGSGNGAAAVQTGRANDAGIVQSGSGSLATVVQTGDAHTARVLQYGNANNAQLTQSGTRTFARILQAGDHEAAAYDLKDGERLFVFQTPRRTIIRRIQGVTTPR